MLLYMMAMSTVAIVDDDEAVRRALRRLFLSLSCQTTEFASGAAFLGALEETTPTCAFVDLHMPEMNGLDVLKRTRSEGYAFPVIIITWALSVSAPCRGGNSWMVFRCAARNGPAAVGAHNFDARNLRPT